MEIASVEPLGDRLEPAIEALRRGAMAMLVDRGAGGGGHLVAVASSIGAETVATMLREAVGMPFLALSEERCEALELTPIGAGSEMMITIESRHGTSTGISASDRALTMRVAAGPAYTAVDVVKPGHVLPIRVPADRLLSRPDAAATALELAALAGSPGGAALCQVLDADGAPAAVAEAEELARRLEIPLADSLEVVEHRLRATALVHRDGAERIVATAAGPLRCVSYRGRGGGRRHFALLHGDPALPEPIHLETVVQDPPADAFASAGVDRPPQAALAAVVGRGRGVVLYLAAEDAEPAGDAALARSRRAHLIRQILRDLGVAAIATGPPA
ncbi:MAG: 3,4-dihydroxy-2-butanone-4-phosphate synthase [Actinobacteria bacterium]|nr:3,4-dihydroxy-2-butanone-4-phosphate synthase [Actinomycetota bacterium]